MDNTWKDTLSSEDPLEWEWDNINQGDFVEVTQSGRNVLFHKHSSHGTAVVRGTRPMTEGQHFWEVKMMSSIYGTDVMVGVGTSEAEVIQVRDRFMSFLGRDNRSWGYSYKGKIHHNGVFRSYGERFRLGTVIGVHLDMWRGTLSFYKDKKPLGVACSGLKGKTLYAMASSTAASSSMQLLRSTSFPSSLQFMCCSRVKELVRDDDLDMLTDDRLLPPGLRRYLKDNLGWFFEKSIPGSDTPDVEPLSQQQPTALVDAILSRAEMLIPQQQALLIRLNRNRPGYGLLRNPGEHRMHPHSLMLIRSQDQIQMMVARPPRNTEAQNAGANGTTSPAKDGESAVAEGTDGSTAGSSSATPGSGHQGSAKPLSAVGRGIFKKTLVTTRNGSSISLISKRSEPSLGEASDTQGSSKEVSSPMEYNPRLLMSTLSRIRNSRRQAERTAQESQSAPHCASCTCGKSSGDAAKAPEGRSGSPVSSLIQKCLEDITKRSKNGSAGSICDVAVECVVQTSDMATQYVEKDTKRMKIGPELNVPLSPVNHTLDSSKRDVEVNLLKESSPVKKYTCSECAYSYYMGFSDANACTHQPSSSRTNLDSSGDVEDIYK